MSSTTPHAPSKASRIPVARPRLATLAEALPYLETIDASGVYSNFGPLNSRFEARLADWFGLASGSVVSCNNATNGLTVALQCAAARGGRYCLMPAWTFAATAHAAVAAGLTPYLLDVDPDSGALTPEIALAAAGHISERIGAVVPVSPFGLPVDPTGWDAFQAVTGIGVVLDAAAGFDALGVGQAPAVVSLHATKVLGIGEGGFIVSRDPSATVEIRRRSNFGFDGDRQAIFGGCNAKLSEIGAAYGLAALDQWPSQRQSYQKVLGRYLDALKDVASLKLASGLGETWVTSTFNIEAPEAAAVEIERRLARSAIATRRWWGRGLHHHPAFHGSPRTDLPVTDRLAANTLGLPCWPDLEAAAVDEVVGVVCDVMGA